MPREFNPDGPMGYLITFRCYGTWVHGDGPGSTDPRHNLYGSEWRVPDAGLARGNRERMDQPPMYLTDTMRDLAHGAIAEVCEARGWRLHVSSIQDDHVHVVACLPDKPEIAMNSFKSWITRRLREAGLVEPDRKVWSRHGSTKYLWTDDEVERACDYVRNGQQYPGRKGRDDTPNQ